MALRDVNLIPSEVLERTAVRRHLTLWIACLLAGLSLVGAAGGLYLSRYAARHPPPRPAIHAQETAVNVALAEVQKVQAELEALSFIGKIKARHSYADVLLTLSRTLAPTVWLQELRLSGRGGAAGVKQIELKGFAFSNADAGVLIDRLSQTPMFSSVTLKSTEERDGSDAGAAGYLPARLVQFEVVAVLSGKE